jgi:hypothetical protein
MEQEFDAFRSQKVYSLVLVARDQNVVLVIATALVSHDKTLQKTDAGKLPSSSMSRPKTMGLKGTV